MSARQPTCFTRVAGPVIQIRGAKKRRPQTLQIKEEDEEEMTEEERIEALEKQRIYSSFNPLSTMWSVDAETLGEYRHCATGRGLPLQGKII